MPGACASPWAREWITAPAARVDVGGTTASVAGIAVAVQLDFVPKCGQNYLARTSVTSLTQTHFLVVFFIKVCLSFAINTSF